MTKVRFIGEVLMYTLFTHAALRFFISDIFWIWGLTVVGCACIIHMAIQEYRTQTPHD